MIFLKIQETGLEEPQQEKISTAINPFSLTQNFKVLPN
jgi:hypothetical protein